MHQYLRKTIQDLKVEIADLVSRHPVIRTKQPMGHKIVVKVSFSFKPIPSETEVIIFQQKEKDLKLKKSSRPFVREHFEALLELPLSGLDREFVEFFMRRKNQPMTPTEWTDKGFARIGRMASINRMCIQHGLWIRFVQNGVKRKPNSWWDFEYQFFVMEEKEN